MADLPVVRKPPAFYTMRTLLGYGGSQDLNRVILYGPHEFEFVLCQIEEPRTREQEERWRRLAFELTELWEFVDRSFDV